MGGIENEGEGARERMRGEHRARMLYQEVNAEPCSLWGIHSSEVAEEIVGPGGCSRGFRGVLGLEVRSPGELRELLGATR